LLRFPPIASSRQRLVSGLLRAPRPSRFAARISETTFGDKGSIACALTDAADDPAAEDRARRLAAYIDGARIGGAFWGARPTWPAGVRFIVKLDHRALVAEAVAFALQGRSAGRIGLVLPPQTWARATAIEAGKQGLACYVGDTDPWALLDQTDEILVEGGDDLVPLALLAGRPVHTASAGPLTGWRLTDDLPGVPQRGKRSLGQALRATLIDGVRYIDPFTGRATTAEVLVEWLADLRRMADEDRDLACMAGVARWKRRRLKQFFALATPGSPFVDDAEDCVKRAQASGGAIGVWPAATPEALIARAEQAGAPIRRIEDGFVRSVGLGSDLLPPCSIVVDRLGIYYDPGQPSDLERILMETAFTPRLRARGVALVERLLARRITKYNTGGDAFVRPDAPRVVLVPGQVEDDRSFQLGGAGCLGNLDLVRRARANDPDAYLVYRPHPDVEAGNRIGAVADADILRYADRIDRASSMPALLEAVDAVHTVSSLAGFEALLRGREVIVHGQPFYAGWGLTRDLTPLPRRGRNLSLAELVAGALILYPRYLDPVTGLLCPPEVLIERLARLRGGTMMSRLVLRGLRRRFEGPAVALARALTRKA
jgi:capsular polysaccharide export protein